MQEISFTLDLEDNREDPALPSRFVAATEALLPFLAEVGVRATIFVVGEVARSHPDLVAAVVSAGHELAVHGDRHVPLPELDPATLARDLRRARATLEDLGATSVVGFRAPYFSLVPEAAWAADVLASEGFTYSSSVLPARSPLYGWADAPARPFRWPSGVLELPVPVAAIGGTGLPFLGGVYLRVLPRAGVRAGLRAAGDRQLLWTYCHPYDFDAAEPFRVIPAEGRLRSRLLWLARSRMRDRLAWILAGRPARPLGERVRAGIPVLATAPRPAPAR